MSEEMPDELFNLRGCFRGEDVSVEEYFACLPMVMAEYEMENMISSPKYQFSGKNGYGTRVMVVFNPESQDMDFDIFDVDEMLKDMRNFGRKYDA